MYESQTGQSEGPAPRKQRRQETVDRATVGLLSARDFLGWRLWMHLSTFRLGSSLSLRSTSSQCSQRAGWKRIGRAWLLWKRWEAGARRGKGPKESLPARSERTGTL